MEDQILVKYNKYRKVSQIVAEVKFNFLLFLKKSHGFFF